MMQDMGRYQEVAEEVREEENEVVDEGEEEY
jgi:hypothetical protein